MSHALNDDLRTRPCPRRFSRFAFHSWTYQIHELPHHCRSRIVSMQRLIFWIHKHLLTPDQEFPCAHTPITSAAMAVTTFNGTAILLIVTHLSLSVPLITTPHPLLPLSLEPPSQNPFTAFHFSVLPLLSTIIFLCPSAPKLAQWSATWLCLRKMFDMVVNLRHRFVDLLFSTMSAGFFEFGQLFLGTSIPDNTDHWSISPPLHCLHIKHCRPFFTCTDDCVRGPRTFGVFSLTFFPSLFFPVYGRAQNFSFIHPVFLTSPVRGDLIPDASSIVPPTYASISCSCTGRLSYLLDCHHLVLLHLKTLFRVLVTALGLSSQTHPMALHLISAVTLYRKGK